MIDRAAFFREVRARVSRLNQGQVDGFNALLDTHRDHFPDMPMHHLAYVLATAWHETARTMEPIEEIGRGRARSYGLPDPQTGKIYFGRGFVQLTWRSNYERATTELRKRRLIGPQDSLVTEPTLAMRDDLAAAILFAGMDEGWFASKKVGGKWIPFRLGNTIFSPLRADWIEARRIVNGTDRAEAIADLAAAFHSALQAGVKPAHDPPPPVVPAPVAPSQPAALAGFFMWLRNLFRRA